MKYLKYFEEASAYEAYKSGSDYVLPNVSYVVEGDKVEYNPYIAPLVYNMVDLGLPSGLLWADRNVGATSPEDAGLYFHWGDAVGYTSEQVANGEKTFGNNSNYSKPNEFNDGATFNIGPQYKTPSESNFTELFTKTNVLFITLQNEEIPQSTVKKEGWDVIGGQYNLKGIKCIGSNGNYIFIPASGYYNYQNILKGFNGYTELWTSTNNYRVDNAQAYSINTNGYIGQTTTYVSDGATIRPIQIK